MSASRAGTAKKGKQKNDLLQAHEENKRNAEDENDMYLRVKDHVFNYFQETTVHGFRYVVEGVNIYERGLWMIFITCAITYAGTLINVSLDENKVNPITTTIASKPTNEVPFPAVTVGSGQIIDPFGYIRRSQHQITYEAFPDGNAIIFVTLSDLATHSYSRNDGPQEPDVLEGPEHCL